MKDPLAKLKKAHAEGKAIEWRRGENSWIEIPYPFWNDEPSEYRIKKDIAVDYRDKPKPKIRWQVVIDCGSREEARLALAEVLARLSNTAKIKDIGK